MIVSLTKMTCFTKNTDVKGVAIKITIIVNDGIYNIYNKWAYI